MQAHDQLINAIGGNGDNRHFDIMGNRTPRWTAASRAVGVGKVEDARWEGKSKVTVRTIARQESFIVHSLFLCPIPEDKRRYPALEYLWRIGLGLVPHDKMHLFLLNVVPSLRELFCGDNDKLGDDQPWFMTNAAREAIGREMRAGRATVPLSPARSLRNINKRSSSFKAVHWMYFLLSIGEVVLADRTPDDYFKMFMLLCRAGRIRFKPRAITAGDLSDADELLKLFRVAFYTQVYAGKEKKLRVCRPTIVALLAVQANLRSCGPAWSYWQFPAERLIDTLTRFICLRRFPYAALTNAVSAKYIAELVTTYAEGHLAQAWADATGKPTRLENQDLVGIFSISKEPKVDLLPPRQSVSSLIGQELSHMHAVLALEGASVVPEKIFSKRYFRLRLANGQISGSVSSSKELDDRGQD